MAIIFYYFFGIFGLLLISTGMVIFFTELIQPFKIEDALPKAGSSIVLGILFAMCCGIIGSWIF